jgi:hypothetical protein
MSNWPPDHELVGGGRLSIAPASAWSIGNSGMALGQNTTPVSTALVANRVYLCPFRVPRIMTAYQMVVAGGTTAAGNFKCGWYDWFGNLILDSGSIVKLAGAETVVNITDTVVLPGRYWLALVPDGANNYLCTAVANVGQMAAMGVRQATPGSFTLPDPLTFQTPAGLVLPVLSIWMSAK